MGFSIIPDYDPVLEAIREVQDMISFPLVEPFINKTNLKFYPCFAFENEFPLSTLSRFSCEKGWLLFEYENIGFTSSLSRPHHFDYFSFYSNHVSYPYINKEIELIKVINFYVKF